MASVFYGQQRGQADAQPFVVAESAATSASNDVEVRIDTGKGTTKLDTVKMLENIIRYIEGGIKPGGATYPDI